MDNCTHCGKKLNNLKVKASLYLVVDRRSNGGWEKINNSEVINSELLCKECFELLTEKTKQVKKD